MHCRLTRAERLATRFALAITPALALGCSSVELVGIDTATVLKADARVDGPSPDASASAPSARDANAGDAGASDGGHAPSRNDSGAHDGGALSVWTDPERPAPWPGQFVDSSSSCPTNEPTASARCEVEGQQCDYPVCWGRGNRSWVCVEQRYVLWFDESFRCDDARPCPAASPTQGAACSVRVECVYPYFCCKGPTGYQPAVCDGRWNLGQPECVGCIAPTP